MKNVFSDWLRVDLHMHTDLSNTTKDKDYKGVFTVEVLKSKLKENNVDIFSLTDHNIVNIPAYKEYYEKYNPKEDPLLLLGIELDVEVKQRDDTCKDYHTLLIFNIADIDGANDISTKLEGIYAVNGITENKERKLTIEDIAETFNTYEFFFIPHADSDKDIVSAYKNVSIVDAQKMVLLMPSALDKVTKEETIQCYNKNFDKLLTESFRNKHDIPYITFSDNHCIAKYPCRHKGENNIGDHAFYYVKGSKCYESIRLAFIDPESRIIKEEQYDNIKKAQAQLITELQIEDSDNITEVKLQFSPHLNVIIGGRSSGKSLLMWLMGKKIGENTKEGYEKYDPNKVVLKTNIDASFKSQITLDEHIYIKQGDIIDYFEKGKLHVLADKSGNKLYYEECKGKLREEKRLIEDSINRVINNYSNLYDSNIREKLVLHSKTIDNTESDSYILKYNKDNVLKKIDHTEELSTAVTLVNEIEHKLGTILLKDELFNINEEEKTIISKTMSILVDKKEVLSHKCLINNTQIKFISSIDTLIKQKSDALDLGSNAKTKSLEDIKKFKGKIHERFGLLQKLMVSIKKISELNQHSTSEFEVSPQIKLVLSAVYNGNIIESMKDAIKDADSTLYKSMIDLLYERLKIKNHSDNTTDNLKKKFSSQLKHIYEAYENPKDYLKYEDGEISKDRSPGYNSEKYLSIILNNPSVNTIFIDQPEDNLGNKFISEDLVRDIRKLKMNKQIFLVTHNPSVVVYGDAESVIIAANENNKISYKQIVLENSQSQKEICDILDGGEYIFNNRYNKYNIQRILKK